MANNLLRSHRMEPKVRPLPAPNELPPLPDGPVRRSPWVAVAAGAVGLLIGWWLNSGIGAAPVQPVTALGAEVEQRGLADAIVGLNDTLLVVATNGSEAMELAMWPPRGPLASRPLPATWTAITFNQQPFADFAAFDSAGRQVALAAPIAREQSVALLAGRLEEVVAVASGVTSYAWHVTAPHSLAYVIEENGHFIEVMTGAPRSVRRVGSAPTGKRLVAWGDWGFVLAGDGVIELADGSVSTSGRYVTAGAEGVVVVDGTGPKLWDPSTGTSQALAGPAELVAAAFAPDGGRIAYATSAGLVIGDRAGETQVTIDWPFVEMVEWSSDGDFIVFADRLDVMFLEVDSGEVTATGLGPSVAVALRPPFSSR